MQAGGVVVADVATQGAPELVVGGKDHAACELPFERMKEGLHVGVVAGAPDAGALEDAEAGDVGV